MKANDEGRKRSDQPTARERMKDESGFTLVELLVVIGILAVLIAILMPALNRARMSADLVKCQANFRQIYAAVSIYTNESITLEEL